MIELDYIDGFPILEEKPKGCQHWWVQYRGIIEVFNYCDKCGVKQGEERDEDSERNNNLQDSSR